MTTDGGVDGLYTVQIYIPILSSFNRWAYNYQAEYKIWTIFPSCRFLLYKKYIRDSENIPIVICGTGRALWSAKSMNETSLGDPDTERCGAVGSVEKSTTGLRR